MDMLVHSRGEAWCHVTRVGWGRLCVRHVLRGRGAALLRDSAGSVPGSMLTTFSESAELMDLLPVCYLRVQCGLNPPRVISAIAPSKSTSGVLSRWSGTTPPG